MNTESIQFLLLRQNANVLSICSSTDLQACFYAIVVAVWFFARIFHHGIFAIHVLVGKKKTRYSMSAHFDLGKKSIHAMLFSENKTPTR